MTDQFYSENYARIIAYTSTDVESDEAFATVQAVQDVAARHYGTFYTAGQSANLYDMKNIVAVDNVVVSGIAVVAILCVLLVTFRSIALPLVLLLTIESGIWINLSIPYFTGEPVNFIGYLVINTVQLGATIDYGILLTTHYLDHRRRAPGHTPCARRDVSVPSGVGGHPGDGGLRAFVHVVHVSRGQPGPSARARRASVPRPRDVFPSRPARVSGRIHTPYHVACRFLPYPAQGGER